MPLPNIVLTTKFYGCLLCSILVSYGYSSKWPQTLWFKTTEIHSFTVLEAISLKSVLLSEIKLFSELYSLQRLSGRNRSLLLPILVVYQHSMSCDQISLWTAKGIAHSCHKSLIFLKLFYQMSACDNKVVKPNYSNFCKNTWMCLVFSSALSPLGSCYGLNCVPLKFLCWSPNVQYLIKWLYLEIESLKSY